MPEVVPTTDVVPDVPEGAEGSVAETIKGYAGDAVEHARLFRLLKFLGLVDSDEEAELILPLTPPLPPILPQVGPSGKMPASGAPLSPEEAEARGIPMAGERISGGPSMTILRSPDIAGIKDKMPSAVDAGIPKGGRSKENSLKTAESLPVRVAGELMRWARRTGQELSRHGTVRRDIRDVAKQLRHDSLELKGLNTGLTTLRDGLKALGKKPDPTAMDPINKAIRGYTNVQAKGRLDVAQSVMHARQKQLLGLQDQLGDLQSRERVMAGVGAAGIIGTGAAAIGGLSDPGIFEAIGFKQSADNPFERVMRAKFAQQGYYEEDPYAQERFMSREDLESLGAISDEESQKQVARMAALGLGAGGAYMMSPWGTAAAAKTKIQPVREALGLVPSGGAPSKGVPYQIARKELSNMGLDVEESLKWYQKLPGANRSAHAEASLDKLERELSRKIRTRRMLPFMLLGGGLGLGLMSRARREAEDIGDVFNA